MVAQFPYRWGYDDIMYRISRGRGILKLTKVVGTGLNQKAISGSIRKVVKVVGAGGNRKPISGVMGRVFVFFFTERVGPYPQAQFYWAGQTMGWIAY